MVYRTGSTARMDSHAFAAGPAAAYIRTLGLRSGVGVPIIVDGRLWGAAIVGSTRPEPLPPDTETRVGDFTDSSQLRSRTPRHAHSSPLPGPETLAAPTAPDAG